MSGTGLNLVASAHAGKQFDCRRPASANRPGDGCGCMATKISVLVEGPMGLDGADALRADLAQSTGLTWSVEEVHREKVLSGGAVGFVIGAIVSQAAEMALSTMVDAAKSALERARSKQLDPPIMTTKTEDVQEPGQETATAAKAGSDLEDLVD